MKKRTRSRELALQFLYQYDLRGEEMRDQLATFVRGEESDRATADFAIHLAQGTLEHLAPINELIRSVAQNWDLERMAVIDRNVLRLATYELLYRDDIPLKVSINEAIELGKRFSTQNSGGFINGILDRIKGKAETGASPAPASASPSVSEPDSDSDSDSDSDTLAR